MLTTTTINGKQAYVYTPSDYVSTKKYPCLVFLPGLGETAGSVTKLNIHGPFLYINSATNLGLEIIVIAIQPNESYGMDTVGNEAKADLSAISAAYGVSKFYLTGLSLGCQEWMNYFWQPKQDLSQIGGLFMFSADPPDLPPYGTGVKDYTLFAKNSIVYYGGCGTTDNMYGMQYPDYQGILAAKGIAFWDQWAGVGHGDPVWSDGYNPAWKSPSMGMSIYAKVAALSAVTTPPPVVVTPAPVGTTFPLATTTQIQAIISPTVSLTYFNITTGKLTTYNGSTWN